MQEPHLVSESFSVETALDLFFSALDSSTILWRAK